MTRAEATQMQEGTETQVACYIKRLEAIETLYQIQTGSVLGLIDEL